MREPTERPPDKTIHAKAPRYETCRQTFAAPLPLSPAGKSVRSRTANGFNVTKISSRNTTKLNSHSKFDCARGRAALTASSAVNGRIFIVGMAEERRGLAGGTAEFAERRRASADERCGENQQWRIEQRG